MGYVSRTQFHTVSLERLTRRSSIIVLASRTGEPRIESIPMMTPDGAPARGTPPLQIPEKVELALYPFAVRETLTSDEPMEPSIEVVEPSDLRNLTWARIMIERKVSKSFIGKRYESSLGSSLGDLGDGEVLLFLQPDEIGLTLETDGSFEAPSFREAVMGWIREPNP